MPTYQGVTDLEKIALYNAELNRLALAAFPFEFKGARFRAPGGDGTPETVRVGNPLHPKLAWFGALGRKKKKHVNLVVVEAHGRYKDEVSYEILMQFNLPAIAGSRPAGRLLVEDESSEVVLAHSGRINRVVPLKTRLVLDRFRDQLVTATYGRKSTQVIAIARLSDIDMIDKMCRFAIELRGAAGDLGSGNDG